MTLQREIIKKLNVKPVINPSEEIRTRINFLKEYLIKSKSNGFVLGISGGQDSTLAGKLAQLAVEELREEGHNALFIAVRLPYNKQLDEEDAQLAMTFINPDKAVIFDIAPTVDVFSNSFLHSTETTLSDFNKGNVKARIRMVTQYAIAGTNNLLVVGTDHAAEALTGFYTKYGDGGSDLFPLSGLSKRQGRSLLIELKADERLYTKTPTADLLDNKPLQSDETELGISYNEIDDYLEGLQVSNEVSDIIEKQYLKTEHKRTLPVSIHDNWWR